MMWSEYRYIESCRRETELQDLDAVGDANVRARYEQRYGYGSAVRRAPIILSIAA